MARLLWSVAFGLYGRIVTWRMIPTVASFLSVILRPLRIRRSVAITNVSSVRLDPTPEVERLEREAFRNLVRVYLELPWIAHADPDRIRRYLQFSNPELLCDVSFENQGALLLSGHVGNWELLALGAGLVANREIVIPVRRQKDYGHLNRLRSRFGNRPVVLEDDRTGRTLRELSEGGVIAMLPDQSPSPDDPEIEFLGVPTRFHTGPARIALRFRPTVIVGFARRTDSGTYHVRLSRLRYDDLDNSPEGVIEFTRRYAALLAGEIEHDPAAWVWHHRRWKHTEGFRYE